MNSQFRTVGLAIAAGAVVVLAQSPAVADEPPTLESADADAREIFRTRPEARKKKRQRALVNFHAFDPFYYGLEDLEARKFLGQEGQRIEYPQILRDCEVRGKQNFPARYHYEESEPPTLYPGVKFKVLDSDCAPDTLYSWGNQEKLNVFKEMLGSPESPYWERRRAGDAKRSWLDNPKAHEDLFTTRWPMDSFFYGEIPIRLKLAADTKFYFVDQTALEGHDNPTCAFALPFRKVVIATYWKNNRNMSGLDFIICDSTPIESWSYLTIGHYREIYRELKWISFNTDDNYDTWLKHRGRDWLAFFDDTIGSIDGHPVGLPELRERLKNLWSMLPSSDQQNIFYSPYLPPESRTPAHHFQTKIPTYSNPD